MNTRFSRAGGALLTAVLLACPLSAQAAVSIVAPGYDLFQSIAGTNFMGVPLNGVPLGSFNFGGSIGTHNIGNTDTIIHRLSIATPPTIPGTAPTINTEMLALQLVSAVPVDLGLGLDFYYVTLQSARGGPASTGTMDISFANTDGGTFSSFFDVFFDIRKGALNGPIGFSSDLTLSQNGASWNRTAPPGSLVIDGVNNKLNGVDTSSDFWVVPPLTETHPGGGGTHVVTEGSPEPSSLGLFAVAAMGILSRRRA